MNDQLLKHEEGSQLEKQDPKEVDQLKNLEIQIESYSKWIKYSKLVALISFLFFLILLTVNISTKDVINWFIVFLPALLTVMCITLYLNFYLNIQSMIDNLENNKASIGTIISYICLNVASVNMHLYLILLPLKLQGAISQTFIILTIPIYLIFGVGIFYFIFIVPALLQTNLYLEIALTINYFINLFVFIIVLLSRIDSNTQNQYFSAFIPLYIALGLHILYNTVSWIKEESFLKFLPSYLILGLGLSCSIMIGLKADRLLKLDNMIFGIIIITAFHVFAIEKIYYYFFQPEPEEKDEVGRV